MSAGPLIDGASHAVTDPAPGPAPWRTRRILRVLVTMAGLVVLVCAVVLPFAPVSVSEPEIRWPVDPQSPASTMLMLTAYEPAAIEARFSCRVARAAEATPDGLVLATMAPSAWNPEAEALLVRAREGGLTIRSGGQELFRGPLPPGECSFVVSGDALAMSVRLDGTVLSTTPTRMPEVDPDVAPDSEPDPKPITALPEVDALTTSVRAIPGAGPDDLSVRMVVDDYYNTQPAPGKTALMVVMVVALVAGAVAMFLLARRARAESAPPVPAPSWERFAGWARRQRPRLVDVAVPAVIVAWMFLAPMTDDDGYYSAMAANLPFSGYVPNYYQLFNQGFVPFSWPYYLLSWWQTTFGVAPVVLRIPAVVLGIGTWALLRIFVARCDVFALQWRGGAWRPHRGGLLALQIVLATAFLAWWLPYDMGVRPEPVVAFFAVAALVAIAEGVEAQRLHLVGLGVGLSAIGLMAAPTGFIALAPAIAAAPRVWRIIRARSASWWTAAGRWAVVLAPAGIGSLAGFADGSYRDFIHSQAIFAPIQRAETWYAELGRYAQLVDTGSHFGSYARRAAVLVCLLMLVWFVVTAVAARARELSVPPRLLLVGWSTALAFALLMPTPSKPTHHFGAIAGLGAAFLALILVAGPRLLRDMARDRRVPVPALAAAAISAVLVFALAGHGRNMWPFSWGLGVPSYEAYPALGWFAFDQPLWWAVGMGAVTALAAMWAHLRSPEWRPLALALAIPTMVCVFFVANTAWMAGNFVLAASRTSQTYSPQADAWADPLATRCGAAQQIDVLDVASARPLPLAVPPGDPPPPLGPAPSRVSGSTDAPASGQRPELFLPGAWFPGSPPPPELSDRVDIWGSFLVPQPGADGDARVGSFTTPWYRLPPPSQSTDLATLVSGRTGNGNSLRVKYGRATPAGFDLVSSHALGDATDSPDWRAVNITGSAGPPPDADALRLTATASSTSTGGWLAFAAPSLQHWTPLQDYLPADRPVGVAWQLKFLFPCQRQPRQQGGVTEPAVAAIGYGSDPLSGLSDWPFDSGRGGLMGHANREATVTQLATRFRDFPEVDDVQLYDFRQPFPPGHFTLTDNRRTVPGVPATP